MPVISQTIIPILISSFLTILFLQSGFDKVLDWKGNLDFHTKHFVDSPLNRFSKYTLVGITVMEIVCGIFLLSGLVQLLFNGQKNLSYDGCILSSVIFVCLFFGQRISKDYQGAAVLVPYFILSIIGIAFMS